MIDLQALLTQIVSYLFGPTVLGYLIIQLVKRRQGKLTRASAEIAEDKAHDRLDARRLGYIYELRGKLIAAGIDPGPWAKGTEPKD